MSKKLERAIHGPSWVEVILGAVLSAALGVVLGVVVMVIKPVALVKEGGPKEKEKEIAPGTVVYREGSHDAGKAKQVAAKRKAFAMGQSVTLTEDELNSLVPPPAPVAPAPAAKAGAKAAPPPAAAEMLSAGSPNFRIRDGAVQLAVPVNVSVLGFEQKIIVQGHGTFVKQGEEFVFEPDTLYLGSCPMQRLPFASGYVAKKIFSTKRLPGDIATVWPKLASVTVEGNGLKLAMP